MKPGLLIIILYIFLSLSCRKSGPLFDGVTCTGDCIILTGKLSEQQTGNSLAGHEIKFYYTELQGLDPKLKTEYLGIVVTDADGNYSFKFPAYSTYLHGGGHFSIEGVKEGYVNSEINETNKLIVFKPDEISSNVPFVKNLVLWKAAPLKVRVINSNTTAFDVFYFTQVFQTALRNNYSVNGNHAFDTTFNIITASDIKTYINWNTANSFSNGGNVIAAGHDSIIVQDNTTGTITINL